MAKENENNEKDLEQMNARETEQEAVDARPNRDAYSQMWAEDNDDIDFEDKEARYGRAIEDRTELRERRKSDKALDDLFSKHDWLAIMAKELRENPDINPFEWLEGFCNENDLSIQEVLDNPEAKERLAAKITERKKNAADAEAKQKELTENLQKSRDALEEAMPDKTPEEIQELWLGFWKVVEDAENGKVEAKTIIDFAHALSYDDDIKAAREEGGMRARNEKIQNNVRKPSEEMGNLPPTLGQGANAPTKKEPAKKKSFAKTIFEDIE